MNIEKDKAYAEVLRQLPTAELLDRYYKKTPELVVSIYNLSATDFKK